MPTTTGTGHGDHTDFSFAPHDRRNQPRPTLILNFQPPKKELLCEPPSCRTCLQQLSKWNVSAINTSKPELPGLPCAH
jgi:hypothetical protein